MACCLEPELLGENSACMLFSSATKPAAAVARASCSSVLVDAVVLLLHSTDQIAEARSSYLQSLQPFCYRLITRSMTDSATAQSKKQQFR